jgi:N-acetylglucosaminyl-diphospho-decaprenol L-rhamnosyltransferase
MIPLKFLITFSIVSHGQLDMVVNLLQDFRKLKLNNIEILLTLNIDENVLLINHFSDLKVKIIKNNVPKGFGANHNAAFSLSKGSIFVVVNPDIRLKNFDISQLIKVLSAENVGACTPVVLSIEGRNEDHVRRYPTAIRLLKRKLYKNPEPDYVWKTEPIIVDWSAGMFVAFKRKAFADVSGFDEKYFMYMEDADICRRLRKIGWLTVLQPATEVIHDAQRASRHNLTHLKWHLSSAIRFLFLSWPH